MEWPEINYESFEFMTENTEKIVWRRAISAAMADITMDNTKIEPKINALKERMENCQNWNAEYRSILQDCTEIMASCSNEQAIDMAQAGLDALHDLLLYRIDAHTIVAAKDVFVLTSSFPKIPTATLVGSKAPDIDFQFGLTNPTNPQDTLYGMDACAQVDAWHKYGVLETSAAVLAKTTFTSNNIPTVMANKRFILLGCTSELGPAKSLLLIPGVTILGIAPGGKKLDDLLDYARYNAPDDTTFIYPKKGADILSQGPAIAQWILDNTDPKNELVICPLAHGDGEVSVRLAASMDLIVQRLMRQRQNSVLCQYMSPTTVMVLPPTAATNAQSRIEERPTWEKWGTYFSMGRWLQPALPVSNNDYAILNGIVTAQGSCYALAKAAQMWRCMVANYRDNQVVAAPFAPPTRTQSMIRHDEIAAALEGMHHFEPMLAFDVGPASTLMAAILCSQIQFMNRPLPDLDENPYTMFWEGAVHGGVWTCPYTMESISTINWALGRTGYYPKGYMPEAALALPADQRETKPVRDPEEVFREMERT
eukprot:Nitzschia sp. Nitz4//scaffold97_size77645//15164//17289//NITZ4_005512-RA/size77645-processed-gene-0.51-mRNA-1//-1//CDS//3329560638//8734//frame0